MQATECENPLCTVAFGCVRVRKQSSQLIMWEGSSSPIPIGGSVLSPGSRMSLTARAAFSSVINHCGFLSHDACETGRIIAEARGIAHQKTFWIGEQRMEGIGILPAVMPGENAAICHDRLRKALVHEVVTEIDAMAHPLVG